MLAVAPRRRAKRGYERSCRNPSAARAELRHSSQRVTDAVVQRRLAALAHAHGLDGAALWKLAALIDIVANDDEAPTPIREPARAVDVHVADSLSALGIDAVSRARRVADIGAGPGFPGLALAAALPHTRVAVVESVGRKAAFLRRAAAAAGLDNVTVVDQRVEASGRRDASTPTS